MESDDHNLNNREQHDDINGSLLVDSNKCEATLIDKNGNVCNSHSGTCDNLNNNSSDSGIEKDEKTKSADQKAATRLQALAMSEDEDFGELFWNFMDIC